MQSVPRMTYADAMKYYGSDKPDTRFEMKFVELNATSNNVVSGKNFKVFDEAELVVGICAKGCANYTRKQLDELTDYVKRPQIGATGLVYARVNEDGTVKSSVDKFYDEAGRSILDLLKGEGGPAKIAEVFKTAGADVQQSFSNIKQSITSIDFKAAIQPYVSSGNKIAEAADLAVTGLKNLAAKATASGTMTNKADANQSQSSNNQTIKVEDINGILS
jgi:aspartyl-tRNA synthetase